VLDVKWKGSTVIDRAGIEQLIRAGGDAMSRDDSREYRPEIEYLTPLTTRPELPPLPSWQDHEDLVLNGHIALEKNSTRTIDGETLH
jgi:hypothetical protein